ncbi:gasdermin-A-like [Phalacrocorax carbo]|uniref:gasdermin-A-like n=1 Tax=Phalacrocorax carbo TaxID=9209 RepID=UPI00311A4ACC
MFNRVTQSIVKEMDPKGDRDLVPVHSSFKHEHFKLLCLVTRKKKNVFHPFHCYRRTWYKLDDILLPGKYSNSTESLFPSGGSQDAKTFTIKQNTCDRVDGSLNLSVATTSLELNGVASLSKEWSIKLEKKHIEVSKLEPLRTERRINMNHSFIQQLRKKQHKLYVVCETLETSEETSYEESSKAEGSLMAQLYTKFCAKGTRESEQSITIPKGCTVAFSAIQLVIEDKPWDPGCFQSITVRSTVPGPVQRKLSTRAAPSEGNLGALEEEVKWNCQILSMLSSDLAVIVLKAIKAAMRDRKLFQELTQRMQALLDETASCELETQSPDLKDLLSSLQRCPRDPLLELSEAITYALDALDELTMDQLLLLLESLEEKIVSQQLQLVKSILEHNLDNKEGRFSVDASLLSFSQERKEKLTIVMVEMSGVKLQKDGSAVYAEAAFSAMAALYVSLYVLNLLSNSD